MKARRVLAGMAAASLVAAAGVAAGRDRDGSWGPDSGSEAQRGLSAMINRAIRADGPFFTPAEQAVIVKACGYAPGEWDGYSANDVEGEFHCTNGRVVDSPELRAVMRAARPRIERRVDAVMARPEVKSAIARVAEEASAAAMARLAERGRR
jgi:hypothetical protein